MQWIRKSEMTQEEISTECPEVSAISLSFENTNETVRGLGLKSVF
jgi:hypothetical protein